jgi:hypothetical protein
MQTVLYKIVPDPAKNSITASKNYRIFTTGEPLLKAVRIVGFGEELELGDAIADNITRSLRYSTDRSNWSLWYPIAEIGDLVFDEADVFFDIRYDYDDTTFNELTNPLLVEFIKLHVSSTADQGGMLFPPVMCAPEQCPAIIAQNEAYFKPYEAGSAIGIAHELSLQTNKIFGHEVVYFRTEPDRDAGDFIFKEWTLFKTVQRKCIKVMVPENKFPDNKPVYTEFGVDFEVPFEIHIDNIYFQMIFGRKTAPRKTDYLFFPLLNRMYEIQGAYLYRGFMMEPIYWKIQLTKFHPNINMYMNAENRTFLDNLIVTTDQLYGNEAAAQALDALNPQQAKTISTKYDETRRDLHPDLKNKIQDYTYNYSPLIEYYYDMSAIKPALVSYTIDETHVLSTTTPIELIAYQDSDIYGAWQSNLLITGDSNVNSSGSKVKVKMNGPKEEFPSNKKYVLVEGYKTLGFKPTERRDLLSDLLTIQFNRTENAIVYKKSASTVDTPNMTFCELINFKSTQDVIMFKGYEDNQQNGLIITGFITEASVIKNLTIKVTINANDYSFPVGEISFDKWYAVVIPISAQYGQLAVNVYSFQQDPANLKNYNDIIPVYTNYVKTGVFAFETTANWVIPNSNCLVANVRLFNTMIQKEDHEFVISQLFVRDESTLSIIDNARPRLNAPFVAINR